MWLTDISVVLTHTHVVSSLQCEYFDYQNKIFYSYSYKWVASSLQRGCFIFDYQYKIFYFYTWVTCILYFVKFADMAAVSSRRQRAHVFRNVYWSCQAYCTSCSRVAVYRMVSWVREVFIDRCLFWVQIWEKTMSTRGEFVSRVCLCYELILILMVEIMFTLIQWLCKLKSWIRIKIHFCS